LEKPDSLSLPRLAGTYWVVPGKLLAGAYPASLDPEDSKRVLQALLSVGICHVIDLTEVVETLSPGGYYPPYRDRMLALAKEGGRSLVMDRMPIRDTWIPSRVEMCRILDTIDETIGRGGAVFIHCIGGRGRTGIVVGCYLARHGVADDRHIITKIEMLRSHLADKKFPSPETPQQLEFILSWVEGE
jgi:hypothetical protein